MRKQQKISNVTIEYKCDEDASNRLVDLLINFLLESEINEIKEFEPDDGTK